MTATKGELYLVATPIGNLGDLTSRAVEVLGRVDLIAAEDTRSTSHLLQRYAISTKMVSLHEHNERSRARTLVEALLAGRSMALVSDAGTPLINDPGFAVLSAALEAGIKAVPVPGPCALIAALSVSGLATDRFGFYGFPPRTSAARIALFESLLDQPGTLIFYESCHRIIDCLRDCTRVFPCERRLVIARELTKIHETFVRTRVGDVLTIVQDDDTIRKGELVLLIEGACENSKESVLTPDQHRLLAILMDECSLKTAVDIVSKITGLRHRLVYRAALDVEKKKS
ncbi:MAG: 16S rRNA (cytidine(1402)-2'-O)-methyltransferase [Gammaproteobacteria bacterium]